MTAQNFYDYNSDSDCQHLRTRDFHDKPPARLLLGDGANRADRPSSERMAAGHPQGAGRQRARRLRGRQHRSRSYPSRSTPAASRSPTTAPASRRPPSSVPATSAAVRPPGPPTSRSTRGAQGNALQTILAMPYVASGDAGRGRVIIEARGQRHTIEIVDRPGRQVPDHHRRTRSRL